MSLVEDELRVPNYDFSDFVSSSPSIKKSKTISCSSKIFCDPVHGQISLHPVCVAIVDTPQFQRLRSIKQTGFLEYVYPGSIHNRFSHSLGVCYLAGKYIQELREHQPELKISDTDVLCIQLAGLCHDLGHGPFSHTWETFMKVSNARKKNNTSWKHEVVSINMFEYLIKANNLAPVLSDYGIGLKELELVKDFILGKQPKNGSRAFLYQIVNNDDSGLDVDKWDYFLRDCHYLGLPCNFEYTRLMQFAKVFMVDGKSQICFRDKILESVYNVFRTRSNLHRLAYQHKVLIVTEQMFIDAFVIADGKCIGPTGEVLQFWEWSMSAATAKGDALYQALDKYCMLTDYVIFSCLKFATHPDLQRAANIVKAVEKRSSREYGFYQHIALKILPYFVHEDDILSELCLLLPTANEKILDSNMCKLFPKEMFEPVTADDICVKNVSVGWGKGDKNPVDFVHFYSKDSVFTNHTSSCFDVPAMLPKSFQEIQIHVLCRRSDDYAIQVSRWCFENFWKRCTIRSSSHF